MLTRFSTLQRSFLRQYPPYIKSHITTKKFLIPVASRSISYNLNRSTETASKITSKMDTTPMPTDASPAKRQKTSPMVIGTHSGQFHADEALAVYMLRMTPQFADSAVVRSRDNKTLEECDIIVDVTGLYDGTKHFDHHQREFKDTMSEKYTTRLSSAGLVYKHFGRGIIASFLNTKEEDPNVELIFKRLYEGFVEAIDANDNGISPYPATALDPDTKSIVKAGFYAHGISLPSMVNALNPWWNRPISPEETDQRFQQASELMGKAFRDKLDFLCNSWLPARSLVVDALDKRTEMDEGGQIMRFDQSLPWKEHLFKLEEERGELGKTLYVLYSDSGPSGGWRVQAVPESLDSFNSRKPLPEPWRGIRDDNLSELSGIPECVFVHASGFIGGNRTFEGALAMAKKALQF